MKIKLLQVVLMFFTFNYMEANQTVEIDSKQINEMIKTDTLYIIGVDEKYENKIKNFQSIGKGYLEYKSRKLNFANYKKDTSFVVFSKKDEVSIRFLEELKTLGFKKLRYLKNGNKSWIEILTNFRGIKLFSMFIN